MESRGGTAIALLADDTGAQFPVTIDPLFASLEARLTKEAVTEDNFGTSVALVGTVALVGAPHHSTVNAIGVGSAYVFVSTADHRSWSLAAELSAADGRAEDHFGASVALGAFGNTAVVGAPEHGTSGDLHEGCVYVYALTLAHNKLAGQLRAQLTAKDAATGDQLGAAVAVNVFGDTLLVGAPRNSLPLAPVSGAAYLFAATGPVWEQQAKLVAENGASWDSFGSAVALDNGGNKAVVGARFHESEAAPSP